MICCKKPDEIVVLLAVKKIIFCNLIMFLQSCWDFGPILPYQSSCLGEHKKWKIEQQKWACLGFFSFT